MNNYQQQNYENLFMAESKTNNNNNNNNNCSIGKKLNNGISNSV